MTTVVSGFVAKTETPGVDDSDYAFNMRSQTNRPQWDLNVGYQEVGNGFNPEIGFLSRRGYRKPDAMLMTRFRPKDFINIQELRPQSTSAASGASTASRRPGSRISTTTGSSATAPRFTPA